MIEETSRALTEFTQKYCGEWDRVCGHPPASVELLGVPSPCVQQTGADELYWLPQPFTLAQNLEAVERAIEFRIQPSVAAWYSTQFAGDMTAMFGGKSCTLLQTWSEEDFLRVQENLIGHLVMKRRLKQSPTLFIATTDSELEVISVCNLTGEVVLEQLGTEKRSLLAPDLEQFIAELQVELPAGRKG
ncbi:SecY-interacting protein [Erwinia billingiae]|uniref:SecY-interacting protein n=1 Tax=Erwinia billingiae TaxID=182337 RepID=UPI001244F702|nr:SecY-interacting protein [Erwinia billingiae]QEW31000.1 SecY-interacting protein [Erwinia billingiae]